MASATIKIKGDYSGAQKAFAGVKQGAAGLKSALAGIGISLGTAQIISGLKSLNNQFDEIGEKADRLNVSTTAMQKLDYAAQRCGIDAEAVETAFFKMQKTLGEAANGNSAAIVKFKELGLDFEELKNLKPEEIFSRITDAINKIQNPAQKTAAVMDLFGRSGGKMIEFLDQYKSLGAELEARGDIVSDKDIRNAEALNDALLDVQKSLSAIVASTGIGEIFSKGFRGLADLITVIKNLDKADLSGETGRKALAAKAAAKAKKTATKADDPDSLGAFFEAEAKKPAASAYEIAEHNLKYKIQKAQEEAAKTPLQKFKDDFYEKNGGFNSEQKKNLDGLLEALYNAQNPQKEESAKMLYNSNVGLFNNSLTAAGANGGIIQVQQGIEIQRKIQSAVEETARNTAKLANSNGGNAVFQ